MNKQSRRDRGARARRVREEAGLSQADFADLVGCSRQAIGAIEAGGNMSVDHLEAYCIYGKCVANDIVFGTPPKDAEADVARQFAKLDPWLRERLWPLYQVFVRAPAPDRAREPS